MSGRGEAKPDPLVVDDAWILDAAREQLGPTLAARVALTGHVLDFYDLDDEREHQPRSPRAAALLARLGPDREACVIGGATVPQPSVSDGEPVRRLALAIATCEALWGYPLPEQDLATLARAAGFRTQPLEALLSTPYAGLTLEERARIGLVASYRKMRALLEAVATLGVLTRRSHPVDLARLGAILRVAEALAEQGIREVAVTRAADEAIVLQTTSPVVGFDALLLMAKAFKTPVRLAS